MSKFTSNPRRFDPYKNFPFRVRLASSDLDVLDQIVEKGDAKDETTRGVTALFSGQKGTGKTMAAEVIADQLGLKLHRVDLSKVASEYIGETEKNIHAIFDTLESAGVVLLFEEADALFGKRSDVKDSHDRYANIEVGYFLKRLEDFNGVAILATNTKSNIDDAFLRRLRYVVNFSSPG